MSHWPWPWLWPSVPALALTLARALALGACPGRLLCLQPRGLLGAAVLGVMVGLLNALSPHAGTLRYRAQAQLDMGKTPHHLMTSRRAQRQPGGDCVAINIQFYKL